jgi:uncharacterized protein YoxC
MATKDELQTTLKDTYGINKNITQGLTKADCQRLVDILAEEPSMAHLVTAYAEKNSTLGGKNAYYSRMRNQAETKLETLGEEKEKLEAQYRELEASIAVIESSTQGLDQRKQQLLAENQRLAQEVEILSSDNDRLALAVTDLGSRNDELSRANDVLKKDNKDLKNIVDQIRLRLAHDTQELLKYEDSEIRKALIRLFRWTLG